MKQIMSSKLDKKRHDKRHDKPVLITDEEATSIMLDAGSDEQKATRYGLKKDYVRRLNLRSNDKLAIVKNVILADCLESASKIKDYLTPKKYKLSSASQLTVMRRENIYAAQMIENKSTTPSGAGQVINITQILTNAPDIIPSIDIPTDEIINKPLKTDTEDDN